MVATSSGFVWVTRVASSPLRRSAPSRPRRRNASHVWMNVEGSFPSYPCMTTTCSSRSILPRTSSTFASWTGSSTMSVLTSRHVSVSHFPPRLRCWAGLSALRSTRSQNIVASVFSIMARPPSDLSAELLAKDLPHRALGQRVHEPHLLGTLVPRQPRLAEGHDLLGRGARAHLQHHERQHVLAHERIGHADDGGLGGP